MHEASKRPIRKQIINMEVDWKATKASRETKQIPVKDTLELLLNKVEISYLDAICSKFNKLHLKISYFLVQLG